MTVTLHDLEAKIIQKAETRDELSELIKRFNAQYAIVNENGAALVYERVRDPMLERFRIVPYKFGALKQLYMNRFLSIEAPGADGKPKTIAKTWADWWLGAEDRRQYLGGVVFDPTGKAPDTCWNLWSGFAVEPAPGDWSLMRSHIEEVICGGDHGHAEYLLNWLARLSQQPATAGEVAVVLKGKKGTGKGILCNWIVRAWGQHGLRIGHAAHLTGKHNGHLRDCVFLFADEAFFAGNPEHERVLKGLVTDPFIAIEPKFRDLITARNMLHIMMATNDEWVVPATADERRWFVLDVSDRRIGDRVYFKAIAEQMEDGGLAAMIHELVNRDISRFEVRDVPETEALAEQKALSLDSLDKWWRDVLNRGYVWESRFGVTDFMTWRPFASTQLMMKSYLQWCGKHRVNWPMDESLLGKRMTEMYGESKRPRGQHIIGEIEAGGKIEDEEMLVVWQDRARGYDVGVLAKARERFTEVRGAVVDWVDEEPATDDNVVPIRRDEPRREDQGQLGLDDFDRRCGE
jgi:hypothetical protein